MKKIAFSESILNSVRYQNIIKIILDNYDKYALRYNDFAPIVVDSSGPLLNKIWHRGGRCWKKFKNIFPIIGSETIIFCNMNIDYRLFRFAKIIKREIIVDVYISRYETLVLNRKIIKENTKKGKQLLKNEKYIFEKADKLIFLNKKKPE